MSEYEQQEVRTTVERIVKGIATIKRRAFYHGWYASLCFTLMILFAAYAWRAHWLVEVQITPRWLDAVLAVLSLIGFLRLIQKAKA